MGNELIGNGLKGNLVMIDEDGNENIIENVTVKEITRDNNEISEIDALQDYKNSFVLTTNYECSLSLKNITRKKFIKILMGKGIARNGAKDIADYILKKYGYYNINLILYL